MHSRPAFRAPPHSHINMYKKRVHTNNFAPEFRKDVVMAPESYDNRFQSHAMPSNKVIEIYMEDFKTSYLKNTIQYSLTMMQILIVIFGIHILIVTFSRLNKAINISGTMIL